MNQIQQQPRLVQVNINQIQQKCRSKKEYYNFLLIDCDAYLPKKDTINIYFLKQVTTSAKDYIRRSQVKVAAVPQIEGLAVEDFLKYARDKPILMKHLPDESGWNHVDRKWVCDVLYTLDTQGIQAMINRAMERRKAKLEQSQNQLVEMRPEFAEALRKSINFSTDKGKSVALLKPSSKQKRKRSEIEEVKTEEEMLKQDRQRFLLDFKRMKSNQGVDKDELLYLYQTQEQMENLKNIGYIDDSGQPTKKAKDVS